MPVHHHVPHRLAASLLGDREPGASRNVVNQIKVDDETRQWATVALERMLVDPLGSDRGHLSKNTRKCRISA